MTAYQQDEALKALRGLGAGWWGCRSVTDQLYDSRSSFQPEEAAVRRSLDALYGQHRLLRELREGGRRIVYALP